MLTRLTHTLLFFACVCLLGSCDGKKVFEENKDIPEYVWNNKNLVSFEVNIEDTLSAHNMYINIRNAGGYPYSNIYIFLTTELPNRQKTTDTIECILADKSGRWLGDGSGDIWDNQILYKKGFTFKGKGLYKYTLEQAMRVENLPMIMDVGLRIERSN